MKINCDECMNTYLMLDKGEKIPSPISRHLLGCKKCRNEVRALRQAEKMSIMPLSIPTPVTSGQIQKIMKEIDPTYKPRKYEIPLVAWIVIGIVMIAAMSLYVLISSANTNHHLEFSFYIAFACIVSGYCATFMGTNLDFFIKRVDNLHLSRQ